MVIQEKDSKPPSNNSRQEPTRTNKQIPMMKDMSAMAVTFATPTHNNSNVNMNRRPRAQSLQQHFGDKGSAAGLSAASPRDCSSSGSFVSKLFRMVESEPSTIVSWIRGASAYIVALWACSIFY